METAFSCYRLNYIAAKLLLCEFEFVFISGQGRNRQPGTHGSAGKWNTWNGRSEYLIKESCPDAFFYILVSIFLELNACDIYVQVMHTKHNVYGFVFLLSEQV